ncbi:hypothetical protein IGI04_040064 [Brassica rapa subsp. trilocularis]|uniref:Uncharacterized protein n=1 Tax=Brassica rapa subsp. trilocularis TaxID=1813537 RepID=A0ABQ7KMK7_BRACM|nr:hypothetical protein IGI04_040064 [Brassica rapa subsp. trilocularis]
MNIFTKSNLRKDIFTKSLAVKSCSNLNRTTKYRLSESNGHVSKSAGDKLEYGNQTADKPSSIDTRRPSMHTARNQARAKLGRYVATERPFRSVATYRPSTSQARSLRSNRASVLLGRYVATELEPSSQPSVRPARSLRPSIRPARLLRSDRARAKLGRYVAMTELFQNVKTTPVHAFSSILRCYIPKTVANSVHVFRHSKSSIKLCLAINVSSRNTAQRGLRHDSRPILRFLNQKPVNRRTVYAWFAREDKYNYEDRKKWNISILCYDGLSTEDASFCSHSSALEGGGVTDYSYSWPQNA